MTLFNHTNGTSSFISKAGKKLLTTTAITAVGMMVFSGNAKAANDWSDHVVVGGGGSISVDATTVANTTNITQLGHRVKVQGDGDIKTGWTVNLNQDSSAAQYILYDTEIDPTIINGNLNANGQVFIFDSNGVIFGAGSEVNVGSIVASSGVLESTDLELDEGKVKIALTETDGDVINRGTITASEGGLVGLVAPNVLNRGFINARLGTVAIAAGQMVTLDMYGDGLVEVAVDGELADGLLKNTGEISARGGNVTLSAEIAKDAVNDVINMGGVVTASSASVKGGKIILSGGESGRVNVRGKVSVSGGGGNDAGSVDISGERVRIADTAQVLANADAATAGDIKIIADKTLILDGTVSAQGLVETGFVETSGPIALFGTAASILATREWLLDPTDIDVDAALGGLIEGQLAVGNMTVQTPAAGVEDGDIGVHTVIDWSTDKTFTLNADGDIFFGTGGGLNASGKGNFVANTGDDFRMIGGNSNIIMNGGDVTVKTGDEFTIGEGFILAGGGDITINNTESFEALANSLRTSGKGKITVNQNKDVNGNTSTTNPSIQNAIDAISNTGNGKSTVNVGEGTWAEAVNITKAITVRGSGRNKTTVTPGAGQNGFTIDGIINGEVNISKLGVDGGSAGVHVNDTANVKKLTINKTLMQNNTLQGVAVFGDSVKSTTIQNSDFLDNGAGGSSAGEGDILFYLYNGDITLKNLDIQNNTPTNTADYGIQIRGTDALAQSGKLKLTNVKVSGDYRATQIGIQRYAGLESLAMKNVQLGGQTDALTNSVGWGSLYFSNIGTGDFSIGNTSFNGGVSPFYQHIINDSEVNFDATETTFDGISAADLTVAESFGVENKVFHQLDNNAKGLVTWKDGALFVTGNTLGIQNAINAADAGDTVHVDDSTYTEDLLIDKELKLTGHGTTLGSAGGANLITVTASNVNIDPFTFDGAGLADYGVNANGLGAIGLTIDGNTFKNFKKAGVFVAANGVGTGSIINNIFEGSSKRGVETGTLDGGYTLDITDNTIGSDIDKVQNGVAFGNLRNATINISGGSMDTSGDAITGGNVGSNVALNLTNLDIEAGDEAIDFNGNVDGHVTISGGTLIGAGSGFEANFIGGNGVLDIKGSAVIEGTHATHGYGLNILRAGINGAINVVNSTIKGGFTGIGSDGGTMNVNGSLSVSGGSIEGVNGDGINIADVNGTVSVSDGADIKGAQNGIIVEGTIYGGTFDAASSTVTGTNANGIEIGTVANGSAVDISNNLSIEGALNGVGVNNVSGASAVTIDNNLIEGGINGVSVTGLNPSVAGDAVIDVTNNTIDNKNIGVIANGISDLNIANNMIEGGTTGKNGIIARDSGDVSITGNTANNNVDTAGRPASNYSTGIGIFVTGATGDTEVSGNTTNGNDDGIRIFDTDNALISANIANNNIDKGIITKNSDGTQVLSNTLDGNKTGIWLETSSNSLVDDNDINNSVENAIRLRNNSDNNTLSNNRIDGSDGNGILVAANSDRVTIQSNTIKNISDNGVDLDGSDDSDIIGNDISAVGLDGINVKNSDNINIDNNDIFATAVTFGGGTPGAERDGIQVIGGVDAVINNNRIKGDAAFLSSGATGVLRDGIHVENNAGAHVSNNDIIGDIALLGSPAIGAGRYGIFIGNSANSIVDNNIVAGTGSHGIYMSGSNNADILTNNISFAGGHGIKVNPSDDVVIEGNDISFVDEDGINVNSGKRAEIINNNISNASGDGIDINGNRDVEITGNDINNVDENGIKVAGSKNALIDYNDISGAGIDGINVTNSSSARILWNEITGKATASIFNPFAQSIDGAARDGIHVEESSNVIVDNNTIQGDSANRRKSSIGAGRHGIFISGGQNVLFGNGVQITNNNILGDGNADSVGEDGIHVEDNNGGLFGLRTKVAGNTIEKTGNNGIFADNTQGVIVQDNGIDETGENGIVVSNSWFAQISANRVHDAGNDGIKVNGGRYADIYENHVHRVGDDGIDVDSNDNVDINDNTIKNTGLARRSRDGNGIEVSNSFDADIRDNYIKYAGDDGIDVEDSAYADIRGNEVRHSGDDGIDVEGSYKVDINDNHVHGARGDGIDVEDSEWVDVNDNIINNVGGNGIEVQNSDYADIIGNTISNADENSIYVNPSDYVKILNNNISFSGEDGIHVEGGNDVEISNNIINDSGDDGIDVEGNNLVLVDGNEINNSGDDGIHVIGYNGYFRKFDEKPTAFAFISPIERTSQATITNNIITNSGTPFPEESEEIVAFAKSIKRSGGDGIEVGGFDNILVEGNDVSNSVENGLFVSGASNGSVVVSDNIFTANDIGANFESGDIDLTGEGNRFVGGRIGMRFAPAISYESGPAFALQEIIPFEPTFAPMTLVDNTIGEQIFSGQSSYFVELDNEAFFGPGNPTLLNALDSTYVGTPFGTVKPSVNFSSGFTLAELAYFESKFQHFNDNGNTGLFFFPLLPEIDQEDIFNYFGPNAGALAGLNITILGLPGIPGGAPIALNDIAPAAGGDTSPEALNAIATAAGGDEEGGNSSSCWNDALNTAGSGQAATLSYGGSAEDLLNGEASCGS